MLKRIILRILKLCFLGTCLLYVFGLFDQSHWFLELYVHFLLQYLITFFVLAISFIFLKEITKAIVSIVLCCLLLFQIKPVHNTASVNPESSKEDSSLTILSMNLLSSNTEFEKANSLIISKDPDVIVLIEYTTSWDENIAVKQYPYQIKSIREDHFGIAMYSKLPFEMSELIDFTNSRFPFIHAAFMVGGKVTQILAVHFENPVGWRANGVRNFQMAASANYLNKVDGPKILIGDFNCSPYSHAFKDIMEQSGLRDSRSHMTIGSSWPTFFFPLMIPIDHALVSKEINVREHSLLKFKGSDHKALFVGLNLN